MKDVPLNTLVALENAPLNGLMVRYFVYVWARNRDTNAVEEVGFSTCEVPLRITVTNPKNGNSVERDYVGAGEFLTIPRITATLSTEVRKIKLQLSSLSPAAINVFRAYKARNAPIEIHRGHYDPSTGRLVDPAICRFRGYILGAPIKVPKVGFDGKVSGEAVIEVECASEARILTRKSAQRFSLETIKRRMGDMFGKYLDVAPAWRIWWGQEETVINHLKNKLRERWFK